MPGYAESSLALVAPQGQLASADWLGWLAQFGLEQKAEYVKLDLAPERALERLGVLAELVNRGVGVFVPVFRPVSLEPDSLALLVELRPPWVGVALPTPTESEAEDSGWWAAQFAGLEALHAAMAEARLELVLDPAGWLDSALALGIAQRRALSGLKVALDPLVELRQGLLPKQSFERAKPLLAELICSEARLRLDAEGLCLEPVPLGQGLARVDDLLPGRAEGLIGPALTVASQSSSAGPLESAKWQASRLEELLGQAAKEGKLLLAASRASGDNSYAIYRGAQSESRLAEDLAWLRQRLGLSAAN
jgi:hypothetical protein